MSARETSPNFRVETCKNLSMQKILTVHLNLGIVQKKNNTETSRQGDVMRPKERTQLEVRDSVLQSSLFTPHADIQRESIHI